MAVAPSVAAADAASPVQREILQLFFIILVFALIIGVLVHVLLLAAVQWYRDSPRWRPPKGHPRTHDRRLEIAWTVGPVLILSAVVILTWLALPYVERPPSDVQQIPIDVIGAQWAWRYEYPDWNSTTKNIRSSGTMYIEQGLTFLLRIHSDDVIHSFYVPDLGIKIDAVPGITNIFWVRGDIPGTYTVQCAEFCGLGHSQMHGEVIVFPPGAQAVPYGPPPGATQPGGGSPLYTIVDVEFKEHSGPCYPGKQWSIIPCRIEVGSNFNLTLRVWNNETGLHQFLLSSPFNLVAPEQVAHAAPVFVNFNTGAQGQYEFWCNISGHKDLGMLGILNVTGPQAYNVVIRDTSITPQQIVAPLGLTVNLTILNNGAADHTFGIGPPFDTPALTVPSAQTRQMTIVLNRTTPSTWFGGTTATERQAGIVGELQVIWKGTAPPPPPPPRGFPVVEVTFGLAGLAAIAAIAFNFRLGAAVRRRQRIPPEEQ